MGKIAALSPMREADAPVGEFQECRRHRWPAFTFRSQSPHLRTKRHPLDSPYSTLPFPRPLFMAFRRRWMTVRYSLSLDRKSHRCDPAMRGSLQRLELDVQVALGVDSPDRRIQGSLAQVCPNR
jgi:hypothetical protein